MLRTVAYVLTSFPLPSETFIADEALSLFGQNIQPFILYTKEGNYSKVHPSAQALLDNGQLLQFGTSPRLKLIRLLARLLLRAPLRTLRTLFFAWRNPHRWCYMQALPAAEWCLCKGVDFLHAHFADVNFIYASAISRWTGIPYGVTTHRYDILEDPIDKSTAVRLFEEAALVVTISEFNARYMAKKYGLPISRIQIVHCGIDLGHFAFSGQKQRENGQALRLLNIGRLFPEKAQDVLLTAMSFVKERGIPFTLEIIGAGPLHQDLMKIVDNLGLNDSVIFHGAQTAVFVRERLIAADLFVLSSRAEGLPVVCMEALAVGTPVIATRIFGIPEIIEDGINGLLVPPDDPQALAEAICKVYENPALLKDMPAAGRHTVETSFERGECTKQLVRLWDEAAKRLWQ